MAKLDVAIAGEINLDLIVYGLPQELPTEQELLASGFAMTLGSSSAILAHNLAALGSSVGFVTKAGNDSFGKLALERLVQMGVDVSRVVSTRRIGSGITIILAHGARRRILTYPGTISEVEWADLDLEYLASARHFHMSSLFLHRKLLRHIPDVFRFMKEHGLSTSLDTNDDPEDMWSGELARVLPHVDILFPNEREAKKIAAVDDLEQAVDALSMRVPTVVVKLGSKGAIAAQGRERISVAGVQVNVVDTVGAGDSFDAGFLHQYLKGADLKNCLKYGNLAGAFSTTASGGTEAFRNAEALKEFLVRGAEPGETVS